MSKQTKLKHPQQISFIGRLLAARGATMFFIIKKSEELLLNFYKILQAPCINGNTKDCKFVKQFWEWILKTYNKKMVRYWQWIKRWLFAWRSNKLFNNRIKSIESSLCDYSDAYILVTGNITVTRTIAVPAGSPSGTQSQRKQPVAAATQAAFKNCAPFKDCRTEINDAFVDYTDFINIAMPMYNLSEYSDNYSDTSGSSWGFKRDDITNNENVTNDDNAASFKYKANLVTNNEADGTKKGVKTAVPLEYLSNFWRSLEMPLIKCKVELSLKWVENCVLTRAEIGANIDATGADGATFKIIDAKLYAPIVTLSPEDDVKLVKQLKQRI